MIPVHATEKAAEAGLIAAVITAVVIYGGTEPISWAGAQFLLFGSALAMIVRWSGVPRSGNHPPWIGPALLFFWIGLQRLIVVPSASFLGDRYAFRMAALQLFGCFVAFYLSAILCQNKKRRNHFVAALVGLGLLEALYGLTQHLLKWPRILLYLKPGYAGDANGTYINHDDFAGLIEMTLPFCVALAIAQAWRAARARRASGVRGFLESLGQPAAQKCLLLGFASLLMFLAIAFSQSRMGLLAAAISLAAIGILAGARKSRMRGALLASGMVITGVLAAFWMGVQPIVTHFVNLPREAAVRGALGSRLTIWKDASAMLWKHPWLGAGLGSFPYGFTRVQNTFLGYKVLHAHNDYLEYAVELGIPGALLLFGMIAYVAAGLARACRLPSSDDPDAAAVALGALGATGALLVHSIADFNLHIPANALVFSVALGMGYAAACALKSEQGNRHLATQAAENLSERRARNERAVEVNPRRQRV